MTHIVTGIAQMNRKGLATIYPNIVTLDPIILDLYNSNLLVHGDIVQLTYQDTLPTNVSIKILNTHTNIVGTLQKNMVVIPEDPRYNFNIKISPHPTLKPNLNDLVMVQIDRTKERYFGQFIEILGNRYTHGVDMLAITKQFNLSSNFPKDVLEETSKLPQQPSLTDLQNRQDCRTDQVITIDPTDAKDYDDAIYIEELSNGYKLWVHIADVSHFVPEGSALDKEALNRGNSTYLVDRVIPMLPSQLSNELCSLKANEDRLTKCVEFSINQIGEVEYVKFYSAVINSKARYTYEEAMSIITENNPKTSTDNIILLGHKLAQILRQNRERDGSLNMSGEETKIQLNQNGEFSKIVTVVNDFSHQLIEEFMLLANQAVAQKLKSQNIPSIYRIHQKPDSIKLGQLMQELQRQNLDYGDLNQRDNVKKLINTAPSDIVYKFMSCLKRARYSPKDTGHYGLAKKDYTVLSLMHKVEHQRFLVKTH